MHSLITFYDQYNFLYSLEKNTVCGEDIKNVRMKLSFVEKNSLKIKNKEKIILDSNLNKYLIPLNLNFAHCFLDILATVFFINYFDKDAEFIFYGNHEAYGHDITAWFNKTISRDTSNDPKNNNISGAMKSCFDFIDQLDLFNIKYSYINFENRYLVANKVYIFENQEGGFYYEPKTKVSLYVFKKYVKKIVANNQSNKNINNKNKIYLSRSKKIPKVLTFNNSSLDSYACSTIVPRFNPVSNSRMLNEDVLENFLVETFGFDAIDENKFETLSEQINYISNAKILISQSGAALANCIFMNENSTIVELFGPVNIQNNVEVYHNMWLKIAQRLDHKFISLPHNKDAMEVVNEIKNNKYLYNLLNQ